MRPRWNWKDRGTTGQYNPVERLKNGSNLKYFTGEEDNYLSAMRLYRLRFKTVVKICVAVFVVTTFIVHYTNEKFERTGQILKGIGNRNVVDLVQPFADTFVSEDKHKITGDGLRN